ncbi:transcriptional regulator [Enterobacillus tribolii]|uniref:Uncharacterized protein n=1 Tax=Enterobacillus tribolii TaxID=1487935 RepID=A0A370R2U1_9GAMM|nr:transcriptional regulator [Enterobacillus tribolii]MBW7984719.1 transcriptional regulator [Enterobacillus tribolii]RDK96718.1 hypothetical protein C8D90_101154 [Enterobacillus tribolii]
MNAKKLCKMRRLERRRKVREQAVAGKSLENKIAQTLSGMSRTTCKAIDMAAVGVKEEVGSGSYCLPGVAMYRTKKSKSENITAQV